MAKQNAERGQTPRSEEANPAVQRRLSILRSGVYPPVDADGGARNREELCPSRALRRAALQNTTIKVINEITVRHSDAQGKRSNLADKGPKAIQGDALVREEEWFRRTRWSPEIAAAFEARLQRSRSKFKKAQYLRIQGLTLIMSGDENCVRIGMGLTERVLAEFPDCRTETSSCLHALGTAYERQGAFESAIKLYRQAWAFEREFCGVRTLASLDLAMLIVRTNRRADADEAITATEADISDFFPFIVMQKCLVRATVAWWHGDHNTAAEHARKGLLAAAATHAPTRHQPNLGVVSEGSTPHVAELRRLAALTSNDRANELLP